MAILANEDLLLNSLEVVLVSEFLLMFLTARACAIGGALHFNGSGLCVTDQV